MKNKLNANKPFFSLNKIIDFDAYDEERRPPPKTTDFDLILDRIELSRRSFIKGSGVASAHIGVFGLSSLVSSFGGFTPKSAQAATDIFGFSSIRHNDLDTVTVAEGFDWEILVQWGDPLWSKGEEFQDATRGTAKSQALAYGDNSDGMSLFTINGKYVIASNNEYTNLNIMFGNVEGQKPITDDDVLKAMLAHGVSIFEIEEVNGKWQVVKDSPYNRRITPQTKMELTGPAAGHDLLKTQADPSGRTVLGTFNNCANGQTPWGTYLTCEENFNGYFSSSNPDLKLDNNQKRYGLGHEDWGYHWAQIDNRFDLAKEQNEANRMGYVVEIDVNNATSTPKKRTALGRFKHENANLVIGSDGRVVVYMGDDERGEFIYKYISNQKYVEGGNTDGLLDDGTLYAGKFNDDLSGSWLALSPATTGMSLAEISIFTRNAASKVKATTMDRPEWITSNPLKAETYVALTNNRNRGVKPNAGGDATPVNGPNPREKNVYGQIVKMVPNDGDHSSLKFSWSLFALAGNPSVHNDNRKGSSNITIDNMFNSPDGIEFDSQGRLWIQTDGDYSNKEDFAGMGNNQMLIANPETGEIRRFLVGPKECEITGLCWSADKRTAFVGIQHPGEEGNSHFPKGGNSVPRSAIIAIRKSDNSQIG